jgi:hypothetical protein
MRHMTLKVGTKTAASTIANEGVGFAAGGRPRHAVPHRITSNHITHRSGTASLGSTVGTDIGRATVTHPSMGTGLGGGSCVVRVGINGTRSPSEEGPPKS